MLFVGDDWAEAHHDIEIINDAGKVLARKHLPEGVDGIEVRRQQPRRPVGHAQ